MKGFLTSFAFLILMSALHGTELCSRLGIFLDSSGSTIWEAQSQIEHEIWVRAGLLGLEPSLVYLQWVLDLRGLELITNCKVL